MPPDLVGVIRLDRDGTDVLLQLHPAVLKQDVSILGTATYPVLALLLDHGDQGLATEPTVEEHHVKRETPADGLSNQVSSQLGLGAKGLLAQVEAQ
jgi:hypothetical protein